MQKFTTGYSESKRRSFTKVTIFIAVAVVLMVIIIGAGFHLGVFSGGIDNPTEVIQANIQHATGTAIGETITDSGIRAKIVAVNISDNTTVDIYLTLEDLTGDNFANLPEENVWPTPILNSQDFVSLHGVPEIMYRSNSIWIVRSRTAFSRSGGMVQHLLEDGNVTVAYSEDILGENESMEGMRLSFAFPVLRYNVAFYMRPDLDINLADVVMQPSIRFISESASFGMGHDMSREYSAQIGERLRTEGVDILQPHLHDISLGLEGIAAYISSIGIIDNKLHVQIHEPFPHIGRPWAWLDLRDADNAFVDMHLFFEFSMDNGNAVPITHTHMPLESRDTENTTSHYHEFIFDVDLEQLSNYTLTGEFSNADEVVINWSEQFTAKSFAHIIANDFSIPLETSAITEIRINPVLVHLVVETDQNVFGEDEELIQTIHRPEVIIHTENGALHLNSPTVRICDLTHMQTPFSPFGTFSPVYISYLIGTDQLDLDTIVSIEVDGTLIMLSYGVA
ncbi:MAG: hypothetical protein FWC89_06310 [Defluviitaleaceae bacterium]|nr:hypothetical protein [Defluviitaleaceae bacterium]